MKDCTVLLAGLTTNKNVKRGRDILMVASKKRTKAKAPRKPKSASAVSTDLRSLFPELRKAAYSTKESERQKALLDELKLAYQHKGLVVYIGAGVSRSMGLPSWPELTRILTVRMMTRRVESAISLLGGLSDEQRWRFLESVSEELDSQEIEPKPILMVARSIKDQMGSELPRAIASLLYRRIAFRYRQRQRLAKSKSHSGQLQPPVPPSPLVDAMVALARAERDARGVQAIINYNYDDLLEETLRHQNVRCTTVLSGSQRVPDGSLPSYHVHGLISLKDYVDYQYSSRSKPMQAKGNFVFSEDEYHSEYSDPYKWSNMTQISHLGRFIGLFVGLSMQDPNLRRLIDVTHKQYPENDNFAILPRPISLASSRDSKQTVLRNMFEEVESHSFGRIGVKVLWVDSFEEIGQVIRRVVGDEETAQQPV